MEIQQLRSDMKQDLDRVHNRIDDLAKTHQSTGTAVARILERLEHLQIPGHSDACSVHRADMTRLMSIVEANQGELADVRKNVKETRVEVEEIKQRRAFNRGYIAAIMAGGSAIGAIIGTACLAVVEHFWR